MLVKIKKLGKKKTLVQRSYSIYRLKLPYSFDHESHFFIINRVAWKFYYSERDWYLQ